jgi:hypothetical protein
MKMILQDNSNKDCKFRFHEMGFDISPVRALLLAHLKGGRHKHCYHLPLKEVLISLFLLFSLLLVAPEYISLLHLQ